MDIVERLRDAAALPTGLYAEAADEIAKLREELAAVTRERDEAYKTVDDNWVSHQQLAATKAEVEALRKQLEESRANDRTAMGYLSKVRWVVGGNDFPDMVQRVETLRKDAERLAETLKDANEMFRSAYQVAARNGDGTDWLAFANKLAFSLRRQHRVMYPDQHRTKAEAEQPWKDLGAAIDAAMQPAADEAGKGE